MLFHLKEPNYKTEPPSSIPTRFYGREPQQILDVLDYYIKQTNRDNLWGHPQLAWWLKKKFSAADIEEVREGTFAYFAGMIHVDEGNKNKNLFEHLRVTDDFIVQVPEENLGYFALWRETIPRLKRAELYKLQNPIEMFMNISFVPEDIAQAIMKFNLTKYTEAVSADMARRAELSKHPNVKVDSLERTLAGRRQIKSAMN